MAALSMTDTTDTAAAGAAAAAAEGADHAALHGDARLCRACRHMTEKLEEERARAQIAERAHAAKERLLEIATIETHAVLEAIRVWTATLRQDVSSRSVREMAVSGLEQVLEGHAVLLSELLDTARLDRPRGQLDLALADFQELVEHAVATTATQAAEAGVAVTLARVGEGELTVLADRPRLERAVSSLLTRVLESCARGGTVRVTLASDAVMCVVAVTTERGPTGAAREDVALASARHTLSLHGGALEVRRREGTLVAELRVPRRGAELGDGGPPSRAVLDGKKVVVFHADPEVAELVGILLRERGATILVTRDFASAALACASYEPDVLLVGSEAEGERLRSAISARARVAVVAAPFDARALVAAVART